MMMSTSNDNSANVALTINVGDHNHMLQQIQQASLMVSKLTSLMSQPHPQSAPLNLQSIESAVVGGSDISTKMTETISEIENTAETSKDVSMQQILDYTRSHISNLTNNLDLNSLAWLQNSQANKQALISNYVDVNLSNATAIQSLLDPSMLTSDKFLQLARSIIFVPSHNVLNNFHMQSGNVDDSNQVKQVAVAPFLEISSKQEVLQSGLNNKIALDGQSSMQELTSTSNNSGYLPSYSTNPTDDTSGVQSSSMLENCDLQKEMDRCSTQEIAKRIAMELKRYGIPQAVFSQHILGRSQGTLSDLLRNPKPWSKLKAGRETFRRMWNWLNEPEHLRLAALQGLLPGAKPNPSSTAAAEPPCPAATAAANNVWVSSTSPRNIAGTQKSSSKKPRLVFTEIQRRTLVAIFKEIRRPSKEIQATIAEQLGLKMSTVSNFFMNARRRSIEKYTDSSP